MIVHAFICLVTFFVHLSAPELHVENLTAAAEKKRIKEIEQSWLCINVNIHAAEGSVAPRMISACMCVLHTEL